MDATKKSELQKWSIETLQGKQSPVLGEGAAALNREIMSWLKSFSDIPKEFISSLLPAAKS